MTTSIVKTTTKPTRAECYKIYGNIQAYGDPRDIKDRGDGEYSGAYFQQIMIQHHGPTPSTPDLRPDDVCRDTLAEVRL